MTKGIKHKDIGLELTRTEFEAVDSHELESGTSFPGAPSERDRFYRSDLHQWYIYNGTAWKFMGGSDISDANALVGEVKSGRTFYSVAEPKKTGTMPTVALAPESSAYPAGYHAGDGGGLPAIDADLTPANIKFGKTIFGVFGIIGGEFVSCDRNTGSIYVHTDITSTITTSFSSPNPTGLTYDGAKLISCDNVSSSIYVHTGITSTITTSFSAPYDYPTGLTYDGANLVSCDWEVGSIYVHTGITSTITTSFSSPGPSAYNTYGLTYDGTNLISCNYESDKIYIHTGITSTITTSFNSPGTNPRGLTYDGANLVSCDNVSSSIYVHTGITSTITTSFSSPDTMPTGLSYQLYVS